MGSDLFEDHMTPIGIHRIGLVSSDTTEDVDRETYAMLARTLNTGNVLGFIGAGVSSGYGYPGWDDMLRCAAEYVLLVAHKAEPTQDSLRNGETLLLLIDFLDGVVDRKSRIGETLPGGVRGRIKEVLAIGDQYPSIQTVVDALRNEHGLPPPERLPPLKKIPGSHGAEQKIVVAECCRKSFERMAQNGSLVNKLPSIDDLLREKTAECSDEATEISILRTLQKDLGIQRFLTTNYDLQIEHSCFGLKPNRGRENPRYEGDLENISFTYDPRDISRLVEFGFGHKPRRRVMHLHGMLDDPAENPLIFAERDYQRVYLREDPASRLYRETFESVLEAHPILFIGAGMREEDILRPFRRFLTERRPGDVQRPLFALVPADENQDPAERAARRRFLYSRHGVKVINYRVPSAGVDGDKAGNRLTGALVDEIDKLSRMRQRWWRSWRRKPLLRRRQPESEFIHGNSYAQQNAPKRPWKWPIDKEELLKKAAIFVVGRTGAGKGGFAYDLAQAAKNHPGRTAVVVNIAFTNDFLNVLEQIVQYLDESGAPRQHGDPVERFFSALNRPTRPPVCILGGFDRILYRRGANVSMSEYHRKDQRSDVRVPLADPVDADIERFLNMFKQHGEKSDSSGTLVLTASVFPTTLEDSKACFHCVPLQRGLRQAAEGWLASPLDHHVFALKTIESFERLRKEKLGENFQEELERRLTSMSPQHRPMQVVPALLKAAGSREEEALLKILSYFHAPVHASVIEHLMDDCNAREVANDLAELGLLIKTSRKAGNYEAFSAHPVTRLYFSHRSERISDTTFEPHMFTMSVHAHDNNENVFHSDRAHKRAVQILDRIMERADEILKKSSEDEEAVLFIRSAFNLLRYNWSAATVPRLAEGAREGYVRATPSAYDSYQLYLCRLHNLVRRYRGSNGWNPNIDCTEEKCVRTDENGALYANELSWLYNESGMAAYCAGETTDAHTHFRASQIISQESGSAANTYHFLATELNIALNELDRGRLNYAKERLHTLLRRADVARSDLGRTISGYLGIIAFYLGDREQAIEKLNKAIREHDKDNPDRQNETVAIAGVRYKRRASIFLRFRANLHLVEKNEQARRDLDRSLALAQAANQPDLVYANHVTRARVNRILGDQPESWDLLARCHEFAWRLGSKRLEIDVRIQQAETALAQGNSELTAQFANQGLVLATANGLGLRKTNCLVLLAGALLNQNDTAEALAILERVKREAKRQGYQHMLHEIDILQTKARSTGRPSLLLL